MTAFLTHVMFSWLSYVAGRITIVVSNAAASLLSGQVADWTDDEAWGKVHKTFEVSQFGALNLIQLAAEHMRANQRGVDPASGGGKILIIGSIMYGADQPSYLHQPMYLRGWTACPGLPNVLQYAGLCTPAKVEWPTPWQRPP